MKKTISKLALLGMSATMVAVPSLTISCGSSPIVAANVFYNYEDYIHESVQEGIVSEGLTYATFGDLPEFRNYIAQGKTAGGIGSDYFNAQLAKDGLIKKIDFKAALGFTDAEVATQATLATKLQTIYTPEAWATMAQFDSFIGNADGIPGDDKLFEYTIPYFMQNKVIAINPHKVTRTLENGGFLDVMIDGTQEEVQAEFPIKTYDGILTTLKAKGFDKLAINDYMRDNLMIGSENITTGAGFTGKMDSIQTADAHLAGLAAMTTKFTKANVGFETSGVKNIRNILRTTSNGNPSGANIAGAQVAFGYNGDALFAQNGLFDDTLKSDEVRIINPTNSMFLMDGFVVSKYANEATTAKIYAAANKHLYKDYWKTDDFNFDPETDALTTTNTVALNFDYVNYTPAFKSVYDWAMDADNYFADDAAGSIKKETLGSTRVAAGASQAKITENTVTWPISQPVMTQITSKYNTYKGTK